MKRLPEVASSTARHKRNKTVIAEIDLNTKALLRQFSNSFLSRANHSNSDLKVHNPKYQMVNLKSSYEPHSIMKRQNKILAKFVTPKLPEIEIVKKHEGSFAKVSNFRNAFLKTIQDIIKKPKQQKETEGNLDKKTWKNPGERIRAAVNIYKHEIISKRLPIDESDNDSISDISHK